MDIDAVIIGSGVVGAAVAQRLAARGLACWIVERALRVGGETTERNSGVVHAGLYYPPGSLKTRLCIEGRRALYEWCARAGVAYRRCGKLVVATTDAEEAALEALLAHGRAVGVEELSLAGREELARLEPHVAGRSALRSGTTGIVDPHELTTSLVAGARARGAEVVVAAGVERIEPAPGGGWSVATGRGTVVAGAVVNAAGLYADEVAALAGVGGYRIYPCRGDYFRLSCPMRFSHLVYPVKAKGAAGLGVHLTIDLGGGYRLGPDATYVASKSDYAPAEEKRARFAAAARRLLPGVAEEQLSYDTCGIRPKLRGPADPEERDFVIAEDRPRLVNLVGIESPGLTSALAIAAEVEKILG